jgi:hypothetical protein
MDIPPLWEFIGVTAGVIVGGSAATAAVWKIIKRAGAFIRWCVKFSETMEQVGEALPAMLDIGAEFKNNGGSTLRDVVDEINRKADEAVKKAEAAAEDARAAVREAGLAATKVDEVSRETDRQSKMIEGLAAKQNVKIPPEIHKAEEMPNE